MTDEKTPPKKDNPLWPMRGPHRVPGTPEHLGSTRPYQGAKPDWETKPDATNRT